MNKPYYIITFAQRAGAFFVDVFRADGEHSNYYFFFNKEELSCFVNGWESEYFHGAELY
jgi:hypothetical protein